MIQGGVDIGEGVVERDGGDAEDGGRAEIGDDAGGAPGSGEAAGFWMAEGDVAAPRGGIAWGDDGEAEGGEEVIGLGDEVLGQGEGSGAHGFDATGGVEEGERAAQRGEAEDGGRADVETGCPGGGVVLGGEVEAAGGIYAPPTGEAGRAGGVAGVEPESAGAPGPALRYL